MLRVGVLEGDIATSLDADQLDGLGAAVVARQHQRRLRRRVPPRRGDGAIGPRPTSALAELDLLVIENVGNLVCPAEFDVGEDAKAMVYAVTEGEEKPLKYPVMFRAVDVVVVNKVDLLPHLDVDLDRFLDNLRAVNPTARLIMTSARTGEGVDEWCAWLTGNRRACP